MVDLTTGTREVLLQHADAPETVLYYHEAVLVALNVKIIYYDARFSKQQYTLRSVRYRESTCPNETGST